MLNEIIMELMQSDDYKPRYDKKLIKTYQDASKETKEVIDDMFITLTGYSFNTIITEHYTNEKD